MARRGKPRRLSFIAHSARTRFLHFENLELRVCLTFTHDFVGGQLRFDEQPIWVPPPVPGFGVGHWAPADTHDQLLSIYGDLTTGTIWYETTDNLQPGTPPTVSANDTGVPIPNPTHPTTPTTISILISGLKGNDIVDLFGGANGNLLNIPANAVTSLRFNGHEGNDSFRPPQGKVVLGAQPNIHFNGGADNDTLTGKGDPEEFHGDVGTDTANGGGGNDVLRGGPDRDTIHGDANDDTIDGNDGGDLLWGDDGLDSIDGGDGQDQISGGNHDDTIHAGLDIDIVYGNDGDDTIYGEGIDGEILLDGGNGFDIIVGSGGPDDIVGGANDDTITGGAGDDSIWGDGGNDRLYGEQGNDKIWGGSGNDMIDTGPSGAVANLEDNNAAAGPWFEIAFGEDGDDGIAAGSASGTATGASYLDGGADNDVITGSASFGDTIIGGAGNDLLFGLGGGDSMSGGAGDDTLLSNHIWGPDQQYGGLGPNPGWPDMMGTGDADCNYVDEHQEGDCPSSGGGGGGGSSGGGGGGSSGSGFAMMWQGDETGSVLTGEDCGCSKTAGRKEVRSRGLAELLASRRLYEPTAGGQWRIARPVLSTVDASLEQARRELIFRRPAGRAILDEPEFGRFKRPAADGDQRETLLLEDAEAGENS
jgi:Ca2+-binding RTX toxin-like protein